MKTDRRQVAAYVVIVLFMAVTIGHVANYAGSFETGGWTALGWLYALAVDGAIVVCAWLTLWKTTRTWAWVGYVLAVIASGVLNVAQVRPWSRDFGAWVYAVFPTVAQALLGFLARDAGTFTKSRDSDARVADLRAELKQARAELTGARAEYEQELARLAQARTFKRADKSVYVQLCASLNGNAPADVQAVQDLLNDSGYYAVPGSTARTWAKDASE